MITCSICGYGENSDSAMICIKCGSELPDTRASLLRRPVTSLLSADGIAIEEYARDHHTGPLSRTDIAVYVADADQPLMVKLTRELLLGRFGTSKLEPGVACLDLISYGGMENGVSRRHALLRRLGADIVVIDLDSTNGTWLNGVHLKPQQPVMIRSGDRLLLARLMLQIFLA